MLGARLRIVILRDLQLQEKIQNRHVNCVRHGAPVVACVLIGIKFVSYQRLLNSRFEFRFRERESGAQGMYANCYDLIIAAGLTVCQFYDANQLNTLSGSNSLYSEAVVYNLSYDLGRCCQTTLTPSACQENGLNPTESLNKFYDTNLF